MSFCEMEGLDGWYCTVSLNRHIDRYLNTYMKMKVLHTEWPCYLLRYLLSEFGLASSV